MSLSDLPQVRIAMMMGAKVLLGLKVKETDGPNRGEVVDAINISQGTAPGPKAYWCANTWSFLAEKAWGVCGKKPPFNPGASTSANVSMARMAGQITTDPRPGDAVCFKGESYGTGYEHTGMVWSSPDENGDYSTIEGNEGDKVTMRKRNLKNHPATFINVDG